MDLVKAFRNDVFTDSTIIAAGTGNKHHSVTRIIQKYEADFLSFGKVRFKIEPSGSGQSEKVYTLNEEQATLLMTYLRNNEKVREFKRELVRQFYEMKQLLIQKQTQTYKDTRAYQKEIRKKETETIKAYVDYAIKQGSSNATRYYSSLSRLADKSAGITDRERATLQQLNNLALVENIISNCITNGIDLQEPYKSIYVSCKEKLRQFNEIALIELAQ